MNTLVSQHESGKHCVWGSLLLCSENTCIKTRRYTCSLPMWHSNLPPVCTAVWNGYLTPLSLKEGKTLMEGEKTGTSLKKSWPSETASLTPNPPTTPPPKKKVR